jgi:hypothetical protein
LALLDAGLIIYAVLLFLETAVMVVVSDKIEFDVLEARIDANSTYDLVARSRSTTAQLPAILHSCDWNFHEELLP